MFIKKFGHHDKKDDYLELTRKLFNIDQTRDKTADDEEADKG